MTPSLHSSLHRAALPLCCTALLLPACSRPPAQPPAEQPPLMAGEARFHPMSSMEQLELQQALAPFLQSSVPVELWYSASTRRDDGSFEWCISPAAREAKWICLGTMPQSELQKLAAEKTGSDYGETLDYWLNFELRSGSNRLPISTCPAEEFGVNIGSCTTSVRSRSFHRAIWQFMDRRYNIQKRFDKIVLE